MLDGPNRNIFLILGPSMNITDRKYQHEYEFKYIYIQYIFFLIDILSDS
jgi:hypothetical protein